MKIRIWKRSYKPFQIGGELRKNIATTVEAELSDLIDLGMGFKGLVLKNNGQEYVFERESGGLVGDSVDQVRKDILDCNDISLMCMQIMKAQKEGENAIEMSLEDFWNH